MTPALVAAHDALRCANSVGSGSVGSLTDSAGLYAVWEATDVSQSRSRLLDIGRSDNVRKRIRDYLAAKRPNETLCLHVIDQIIRPDMKADSRGVVTIAVDYVTGCRFAAWTSNRSAPLSALEAALQVEGVDGQRPVLNRPASRRHP